MAKPIGVWGIDIGQCALKTLRCHMEGDQVVADAFDYIEYPKVLSQPEANPAELIKEALEQFLSRNSVRGDRVCIAVSGQSGLARYFKPPPVDAKKIADIVKYEAKQQIPFPLEDVIWDYQRMGGGMEVDGIALETEVGLFAMKREQVYKALQPFTNAEIEVDVIQLAPLSIYNYVVYDLLEKTLPPPEEFDPEKPPKSTVVISMGTDTTDLVVTNGYRVWQRNIPLGGNHFTKQLTKELKLTFAKAEHLKRNAHQAEDPKAVFQAMRPVFNDMVTEMQRSLGYFQSLDRKAEIDNVVILGNTVKLPGLKQYLTKHLGYSVIDFDHFERLSGDAVAKSPAFRENLLAFGVCYGLCLQGLDKGRLATNLLPQEITTERMIRAKKPWAVATAGAFLLACALNYMFHFVAWKDVQESDWKDAITVVNSLKSRSDQLVKADKDAQEKLENISKIGQEVIGSADRRVMWLELLKAINESLPLTEGRAPGQVLDPNIFPLKDQAELHIEAVESEYFADLKTWWEKPGVKEAYQNVLDTATQTTGAGSTGTGATDAPAAGEGANPATPAIPGAAPSVPPTATPGAASPAVTSPMGVSPAATPPTATSPSTATTPAAGTSLPGPPATTTLPGAGPATAAPAVSGGTAISAGGDSADPAKVGDGPSGGGWVIELRGYHYYNDRKNPQRPAGHTHVRQTLVKNLMEGSVELPVGPDQELTSFTMKELGIDYPIFALNGRLIDEEVTNPYYVDEKEDSTSATGSRPAKAKGKSDPANVPYWTATRYDFIIQFVWKEKPWSVRLEERQKAAIEKAKAAGEALPDVPDTTPVEPKPDAVKPADPVDEIPPEEGTAPDAGSVPAGDPMPTADAVPADTAVEPPDADGAPPPEPEPVPEGEAPVEKGDM